MKRQLHRKPAYLLAVAIATLACDGAIAQSYYGKFSGTPSSISCTNTSATIGPGLTYSWNIPPSNLNVHLVQTVTTPSSQPIASSTSGALPNASGTTTFEGSVGPFPSTPFPFAFIFSIILDAPGPPTISQVAFLCASEVGSNFTISNAAPFGPAVNYQGLWWASGGKEPFWGINFVHQGDQVFGTWYTYDTSGKAWWLSTLASRTGPDTNTYTGPIYVDNGPPFNNFVGAGKPTQVGTATLTFTDANNGTFAYTVNTAAATMGMAIAAAVVDQKSIARFDLGTGPQPTCTYSAAPNFAAATNYQDLWWAVGGTESGWGINFAHQGDSVFATWYTYDIDGTPLWLSVLTTRISGSNIYVGPLYRTSGPRFDAYDPAKVVATQVGAATLTFAAGNNATLSYTTSGAGGLPAVTQKKSLTRFLFAAPAGTVCN